MFVQIIKHEHLAPAVVRGMNHGIQPEHDGKNSVPPELRVKPKQDGIGTGCEIYFPVPSGHRALKNLGQAGVNGLAGCLFQLRGILFVQFACQCFHQMNRLGSVDISNLIDIGFGKVLDMKLRRGSAAGQQEKKDNNKKPWHRFENKMKNGGNFLCADITVHFSARLTGACESLRLPFEFFHTFVKGFNSQLDTMVLFFRDAAQAGENIAVRQLQSIINRFAFHQFHSSHCG